VWATVQEALADKTVASLDKAALPEIEESR
jgi:hypothetical protein